MRLGAVVCWTTNMPNQAAQVLKSNKWFLSYSCTVFALLLCVNLWLPLVVKTKQLLTFSQIQLAGNRDPIQSPEVLWAPQYAPKISQKAFSWKYSTCKHQKRQTDLCFPSEQLYRFIFTSTEGKSAESPCWLIFKPSQELVQAYNTKGTSHNLNYIFFLYSKCELYTGV